MVQTSPTGTALIDRALIRLSGDDVRAFVDGLVTNVLDVLPAYAALLNAQGKVIADFIVWPDGKSLKLIDFGLTVPATLIARADEVIE